jgi:hypothetical protein
MPAYNIDFTRDQLLYIEAAVETVKSYADTEYERDLCQQILDRIKY